MVGGNDVDERVRPPERGVDTDDRAVGGELADRVVVRLACQMYERRAIEHGDRRVLRLGSEVDPEQPHTQIMNPRAGRMHGRRLMGGGGQPVKVMSKPNRAAHMLEFALAESVKAR